jgi:hypothetical protein
MLPDLERAERVGEFWSYAQSRTFADLLIDREEDRRLRAVLVGILREGRALSTGEPSGVCLYLGPSTCRWQSSRRWP